MEKQSDLVLGAIGILVIKFKDSSFLHKNHYYQKLIKLYKLYLELLESERVNRKIWVREIFTENQRLLQGSSDNLVSEMRRNDPKKFINFLRMSPETFDLLLSIIQPYIQKQHVIREPIEAKIRLEVTLRYLASGDSMVSMSYSFRIGKQTVSSIISETCEAIWNCLKDQVFLKPTVENWKNVAKSFKQKWNFKNCIGAIDGKHVIMQALPKSGSQYYNYKGSHSINLLAIADANYKFLMVDIGAAGRLSDSGVFQDSQLGQGFEQNIFNVPSPDNLSYVLVADEAFPLTNYMMRPYPRRGNLDMPKKVFNYRLSRARRVVENTFGLLVSKWRIFRKPIIASKTTINKIIQASICLHNFLLMQKIENYLTTDEEIADLPSTTEGLTHITRAGSNTYSKSSASIRGSFTEYFCDHGAVDWQWQKALQNDF